MVSSAQDENPTASDASAPDMSSIVADAFSGLFLDEQSEGSCGSETKPTVANSGNIKLNDPFSKAIEEKCSPVVINYANTRQIKHALHCLKQSVLHQDEEYSNPCTLVETTPLRELDLLSPRSQKLASIDTSRNAIITHGPVLPYSGVHVQADQLLQKHSYVCLSVACG